MKSEWNRNNTKPIVQEFGQVRKMILKNLFSEFLVLTGKLYIIYKKRKETDAKN